MKGNDQTFFLSSCGTSDLIFINLFYHTQPLFWSLMYALLNVSFVLKVVSQVAPSPGYDLDLGKENRFNDKN